MKTCYICGRKISENDPYYCVGPKSYVCMENDNCYNSYWWDRLAAQFVTDALHKYVVINNNLYSIDSNANCPKGYAGKHWTIEFFDGIRRETNSLWFITHIPDNKRYIFKENAKFLSS